MTPCVGFRALLAEWVRFELTCDFSQTHFECAPL